MTYPIVARAEATGQLGVAVQSRWFNVGAGVPWVEPGVGAVATQSFAEIAHGFDGIRLMRDGRTAPEALAAVLATDAGEATRQVGMVDAEGRSAAHTGLRCVDYASHLTAPNVSVQANMMERPTVPAAMLAAFLGSDGELVDRLMAALRAAEREGGDLRGRQSAALVVAPGEGEPWRRVFELRVEDDRAPLAELARLVRVKRAYGAMGEAEDAGARGNGAAALAAGLRATELAPDDDQVRLWSAVGLALAGRAREARAAFESALAVEPRSGEHLRRFARAGHLPGGDAALRVLGIA